MPLEKAKALYEKIKPDYDQNTVVVKKILAIYKRSSDNPELRSLALAAATNLVYTFKSEDVGLELGTYRWLVRSERQVSKVWTTVAESESRVLRIVEQPLLSAAPTLLAPENGTVFRGWEARVNFKWFATEALQADEYYVLIIYHQMGTANIWLKDTFYQIDEERWLSEYGPELEWSVVIARKRTLDPNQDPTGAETSSYSIRYHFLWYPSE